MDEQKYIDLLVNEIDLNPFNALGIYNGHTEIHFKRGGINMIYFIICLLKN